MFVVALAQTIPDEALLRAIVEADTVKILAIVLLAVAVALLVTVWVGTRTLNKLLKDLTDIARKFGEANDKGNNQAAKTAEVIERIAKLDERQTNIIQQNQDLLRETQDSVTQVHDAVRRGFTKQDEVLLTLADRIIGETGAKMDGATNQIIEMLEPVVTALGEIGKVVNEAKALSAEHTQQNVTVQEQVAAMGDRFENAQRQILEAIYEMVAQAQTASAQQAKLEEGTNGI